MTPLKLTDFISVLLDHKRQIAGDINSPIIFSHNYILKFFMIHSEFINVEEVLKIMILQRLKSYKRNF